jgi:hypothetical protein
MKPFLIALLAVSTLATIPGDALAGPRHDAAVVFEIRDGLRHDGERSRGWREERRGDRYDVIPERRIVRRLIRDGYVSVEDIDLRRDRYVVRAIRRNGAVVRLAIDAYDGDIIARERIGWERDRGRDYGRDRHQGRHHDRYSGAAFELDLGGGAIGFYTR